VILYKNRSILLQSCPIIIFSALYLYYGFIINDNFYIFPDSHRYLETGYRWDGYSFLPNLNRLLGDDAQSLAFCLVCLSYISWVSLMVILTLWLRIPWLSFSVVSLIGFIALSARVNQWTHMILSEAPTIFFGILALAFSFKVWAQPWPKEKSSQRFFSGVWFCCFCFAVTCWVFSHPSLFVVALPLTAITTGRFFYHAPVMRCIAPLCFSLLTILPTPLSVGENEWQGPFLHSYCMRVSTDPAFLEAFRDAGMAEPLAPISCAGKWGFDKIFPIYQHPENSAWRQWVDEHGIKTYWMTLFTHPKIFFTPLWKAFDVIYLQQSEALELNRLGPPMAFYRTHHLSPDKPDYQPPSRP